MKQGLRAPKILRPGAVALQALPQGRPWLGLGLDVGEVGWLDPIAGGGRLEEEEAGGVIGLEIGLGKALGEGQESPEHLCDFWRPCRNSPNPKTRPKTTNTVTMKMKIFVAFPT